MNNKKTYYLVILDKSGSMSNCIGATQKGFNAQIDMIRAIRHKFPEQEVCVSFTQFNDQVEEIAHMKQAIDVPHLNQSNYRPQGSTALYDAIGISVTKLQQEIRQEIINNEASVVVVILTDGYENSSKIYNQIQIQHLIKELEATEKWSFSFMSSTPDAVEIAGSMNIKAENSMCFETEEIDQQFEATGEQFEVYIKAKSSGKVMKNFWGK